jgi:DNA-binding SARP family transcriptional activator
MIHTSSADRRHMRPVIFPLGEREDINVMPSLSSSIVKIITGEVAVGSPNGAATTSRCRVSLMGGFRMRSDDRVELPLGAQRLVSYLALEGSWVTRVHTAEMLWPDSRRCQAAANFRTALWRVRGVVGDDVVRTEPGRLALANTVSVDVQDVAKEARALISAPVSHDAGLPAVNAETVSRLSMRLLPGWYDDWVVLEQERWDQLRLYAREAAAEVFLCRGQHVLALEAGLVAARSELFRESAHRIIIRVYLAEGNWGAAMQHYQDYQRKLRRELNLAPTTTMDELMRPLIASHTPQ